MSSNHDARVTKQAPTTAAQSPHRINGSSSYRKRGLGLTLISIVIVAATMLVGCSSGSASKTTTASTINKTKFCQDNSTMHSLTAPVGTPEDGAKSAQLLQIFKDNQATINDFAKTAPSEIQADAQLLVKTISAAIKANSLDGLSKAAGVGGRVDAYCQQTSTGTPAGSTTTP
jgi:hypothetical protein